MCTSKRQPIRGRLLYPSEKRTQTVPSQPEPPRLTQGVWLSQPPGPARPRRSPRAGPLQNPPKLRLEPSESSPLLPAEVQQRIPALRDPRRYIEAFEAITGRAFEPSIEEPMARIRRNLGNFSSEKFDNSERS